MSAPVLSLEGRTGEEWLPSLPSSKLPGADPARAAGARERRGGDRPGRPRRMARRSRPSSPSICGGCEGTAETKEGRPGRSTGSRGPRVDRDGRRRTRFGCRRPPGGRQDEQRDSCSSRPGAGSTAGWARSTTTGANSGPRAGLGRPRWPRSRMRDRPGAHRRAEPPGPRGCATTSSASATATSSSLGHAADQARTPRRGRTLWPVHGHVARRRRQSPEDAGSADAETRVAGLHGALSLTGPVGWRRLRLGKGSDNAQESSVGGGPGGDRLDAVQRLFPHAHAHLHRRQGRAGGEDDREDHASTARPADDEERVQVRRLRPGQGRQRRRDPVLLPRGRGRRHQADERGQVRHRRQVRRAEGAEDERGPR